MPVFGVKGFKNHRVLSLGAIPKILRGYQNCHIGVWKVLIEKIYRSCIWTLFLTQEVKIELSFALRAAVSEIRILIFRHIWAWSLESENSSTSCILGRFSKLPYLGMKPGIWKKCQKLHILLDPLSTPGGRNCATYATSGYYYSYYYYPVLNICMK